MIIEKSLPQSLTALQRTFRVPHTALFGSVPTHVRDTGHLPTALGAGDETVLALHVLVMIA